MKLVDPRIHGIIDYVMATALLLAPTIFAFSGRAATTAYAFGIFHIGTSLLTRYPLSLLNSIPFHLHGTIEKLMAVAVLVAPWLLGFSNQAAARNFFLGAGIALFAVIALTDYKGRRALKGPHAAWSREESYQWQDGMASDPTTGTGNADTTASHRFN